MFKVYNSLYMQLAVWEQLILSKIAFKSVYDMTWHEIKHLNSLQVCS